MKKKFILLLGPTGVGKSKIIEKEYPLVHNNHIKIEIDEFITNNVIYKESILKLTEEYNPELIKEIINGTNNDEKTKLTEDFNKIYFNVKREVKPCDKADFCKSDRQVSLNCNDLHDMKLANAILDNTENKTIVLEINGDKDYSWLFKKLYPNDNAYNDEVRDKLYEEYEIEFIYLSHDFSELIKSNKTRFETNLRNCTIEQCDIRLGNFLLENKYRETIKKILEFHDSFPAEIISKFSIERKYYVRNKEAEYNPLPDFNAYKNAFNDQKINEYSRRFPKVLPRPSVKLTVRGGKSIKRKIKRRRLTKKRKPTKRRRPTKRRAGKSSRA